MQLLMLSQINPLNLHIVKVENIGEEQSQRSILQVEYVKLQHTHVDILFIPVNCKLN